MWACWFGLICFTFPYLIQQLIETWIFLEFQSISNLLAKSGTARA